MTRESTTLPHIKKIIPESKLWDPVKQKGNFDYARKPINLLVIHTMDGYLDGTTSWFFNPDVKTSAHYGCDVDGEDLTQYLEETKVAYHSGKYEVNQRSVSIEVADNTEPAKARSEKLYIFLATWVVEQCRFYEIPIDRDHVKGHREITAGKSCPGSISIDEVVRLAHDIHARQVGAEKPPEVTTAPEKPVEEIIPIKVDPVEYNQAVDVQTVSVINALSEAMNKYHRADGAPYSTMLEFTNDLVERNEHYLDLLAPDADGIPPVVVDASEYDSLFSMAMNFSDVADFYEISQEERIDREAGKKVIQEYLDSRTEVLDIIKDPTAVQSIINQDSGVPTPTEPASNSYQEYSRDFMGKTIKLLNSDVFDLLGKFIALFKHGTRS